MTVDASAAIDVIMRRATALRLCDPAPSRKDIETIIAAGAHAPDHGRLSPWRFFVAEGEARAIIAASMVAIARAGGETNSDVVVRAAEKAFRAPTIIIVAGVLRPDHKVPEVEQLLAVGAAVENMLIAAEALGVGAMWKTGAPAYDAELKHALGLASEDHICAFLYLGTLAAKPPSRPLNAPEVVWLEKCS